MSTSGEPAAASNEADANDKTDTGDATDADDKTDTDDTTDTGDTTDPDDKRDTDPDDKDSGSEDSSNPDDCAEIPQNAHAVLTADVKLVVTLPYSTDDAKASSRKFTLSNDDGSFTKTLTLASDCQAGETETTSVLTFAELSESHTYSLQCDDGDTTHVLFTDATLAALKDLPQPSGGDGDSSDWSDLSAYWLTQQDAPAEDDGGGDDSDGAGGAPAAGEDPGATAGGAP